VRPGSDGWCCVRQPSASGTGPGAPIARLEDPFQRGEVVVRSVLDRACRHRGEQALGTIELERGVEPDDGLAILVCEPIVDANGVGPEVVRMPNRLGCSWAKTSRSLCTRPLGSSRSIAYVESTARFRPRVFRRARTAEFQRGRLSGSEVNAKTSSIGRAVRTLVSKLVMRQPCRALRGRAAVRRAGRPCRGRGRAGRRSASWRRRRGSARG
jgi:hypothetical protein